MSYKLVMHQSGFFMADSIYFKSKLADTDTVADFFSLFKQIYLLFIRTVTEKGALNKISVAIYIHVAWAVFYYYYYYFN